jgi:hypothetical protein
MALYINIRKALSELLSAAYVFKESPGQVHSWNEGPKTSFVHSVNGKSEGLEDILPKWVIQLWFIHSWVVITIDGRIPGFKNLGFKV